MICPRGSLAQAHGTPVMADELAELDELLQRAFRYALSLTHNRERAEELVQDACLSTVRGGGPWRVEYIITIIRNHHIDRCRRRAAITFESLGRRDIVSLSNAFDEPIDTELDMALASLRPDERELLFLAAVEGYTASQIARFTAKPRGTVLSAIFRTKRKLRSILSRFAKAETP